jgi:hypothetical protein
VFFVLTTITTIVIGVIIAAHREMADPFSVFSDLFGDDARQAALVRGFRCQDTELHSYSQIVSGYCAQRSADKTFSGTYLTLSGNVANEVSFSLRDNALALGDLVVLWGKPEIRLYCEVMVASWPARHIMVLVAPPPRSPARRAGGINYFLPVIAVSFTRSGPPHWRWLLMNEVLHNCG